MQWYSQYLSSNCDAINNFGSKKKFQVLVRGQPLIRNPTSPAAPNPAYDAIDAHSSVPRNQDALKKGMAALRVFGKMSDP